jgi:hypothetical protein
MGEGLAVYPRPSAPRFPQVCMDEKGLQLLAAPRPAVAPAPGRVAKGDAEYERHGTCHLFMYFEPLAGRREGTVRAQRTKRAWAECLRELAAEHSPEAERLGVVMDNLHTHHLASRYEAYAPAVARRLAQRGAVH